MRILAVSIVFAWLAACNAPPDTIGEADETVTLIRLAGPRVVDWDTSAVGQLVVRDGCVRLETGGEDYTVVWPQDARLVREHGRLVVASGQWRAPVGETVALAGGETPSLAPDAFDAPVVPSDAGCPPQFWVTHRFQAGQVAP